MADQVLLGEANGKTLVLGLATPGALPSIRTTVPCADEGALMAAIAAFLDEHAAAPPSCAAFCAPGPAIDGVLQLTRYPLRLDRDRLAEASGASSLKLVNNFLARAAAMPLLPDPWLEAIGEARPRGEAPAAAMGPVTGEGLGMAILNPDGFVGWVASPGEGGHADLAAADDREADVIAVLRAQHGHVSSETVLTIDGTRDIHRALTLLAGGPDARLTRDEVQTLAEGGDPTAQLTFQLQSGWVGAVAGNLALTAGARSGVYMFSPFIASWGAQFDRGVCRTRFEAKGRMAGYMTGVPLYLVGADDCGLLGLSALCQSNGLLSMAV
ncbi:MAG: Glucokinase [Caulobacter sp.]|nr:Glucokinase [Caulobacter sp.]